MNYLNWFEWIELLELIWTNEMKWIELFGLNEWTNWIELFDFYFFYLLYSDDSRVILDRNVLCNNPFTRLKHNLTNNGPLSLYNSLRNNPFTRLIWHWLMLACRKADWCSPVARLTDTLEWFKCWAPNFFHLITLFWSMLRIIVALEGVS